MLGQSITVSTEFMHAIINQQILIEHLPYVKHWSTCWKYRAVGKTQNCPL